MKGHVPEANLIRYGARVNVARLLDSAANSVSGMGEYGDANQLWALAEKYRAQAHELRVDIDPEEVRKKLREQVKAENPDVPDDAIDEWIELAEKTGRKMKEEDHG